ncbi:MAG: hypothetical protein K2I64_05335 [Muribaculaceae bacterium]|nr:hypothetical protein [Muribaculaceae bacterium]
MKKIKLITALLATAAFGAVLAKNSARPDFAFPAQVVKTSESTLADALRSGDSKAAVRALIDYTLARNEISTYYMSADIARVDSIAAAETDVATRSLLRLLEADMYTGVYTAERWKFDRREVPAEPLPDDCFEWSGDQFRNRIITLLSEATAAPEQLIRIPVTDWSDVITISTDSRLLYPTLFDFIAWRAIDIYKHIDNTSYEVPARFQTPDRYLEPLPAMGSFSEPDRKIHELYRELVRLHTDNPAPRILAEVAAARFMTKYSSEPLTRLLLDIYHQNESSPWCGLSLESVSLPADTLYPILTEFISKYPDYVNINAIKNTLSRITTPDVRISYPEIIPPGRPVNIKLSVNNARDIAVTFKHTKSGKTVISSLHLDQPIPYKSDTLITVTLPLPGQYTVTSTLDGKASDDRYPSKLRASSFDAMNFTFGSECFIYAVDPLTGAPVEGVTVEKRDNNDSEYSNIGTTGAEGDISYRRLPKQWNRNSLRLTNGTDTTFFRFNTYAYSTDKPTVKAQLFTDLGLYHLGDTLRWALVAFNDSSVVGRRSVAPGKDFIVTIYNSNAQVVQTKSVTTDYSGRAVGSCVLPTEGLSGNYTIKASNSSGRNFYTSVTVNDYKLPTFTVEPGDIRKSLNPDSLVTVSFIAKTYSGFPIAGASVELQLGQSQFNSWRWGGYANNFWSTSSTTDAEGKVALTIPASIIELAPDNGNFFSVSATVTTPSGETQTAKTAFTTGKPYSISYEIPRSINLDDSKPLTAMAVDANDNKVNLGLRINLLSDKGKIAASIAPGNTLPAKLSAGKYTLEIVPADTTLANTVRQDITLYRNSGKCPFSDLIFPVSQIDAKDGKATLIYGNPYPDANLLLIEMADSVITSRRWIKQDAGMHSIDISVPATTPKVKIIIMTFRDCAYHTTNATVINPDYEQELTIETETFRDKVVPGDKETISLLFKDKDGNPVRAYAMLGMSSSAIQKLAYNSWDIPNMTRPDIRWDANSTESFGNLYNSKTSKMLETVTLPQPSFEFYGLSFSGNRNLIFSTKRSARAMSDTKEEVLEDESLASGSFVDALQGQVAGVAVNYDNCVEEAVACKADDAELNTEITTVETGSNSTPDNFQYRPSEIPLAFFEPTLKSDSDGRLTYTYTVPDANTSWEFQALAYTRAMLTSGITRTVVASRPVMVQSNLPRFLRYGDEACIQASVMNLSDTAVRAVTTVTILDASTMKTLLNETYTDQIAPKGSATVSTDYTVPAGNCQAVIYRVKTSAGTHSDGEQDIIPLLPPTQPVITTTPFFVPADTPLATVSIPATPAGASTTLYLYTNPLWEVVTALPSISDGNLTTSVAAGAQLYKASVGRGLMNAYPTVRKGLAEWLSSDKADSTLVSMLERNDDLKQLSFNATPWVRMAMSDRERLDALALMLDDKNTDKAIRETISALGNFQKADGGFSWSPGCEKASQWATERVLAYVSWLDLLGYRPDNAELNTLINGAIGYLDAIAGKTYDKYGSKADYTDYVFLRSLVSGVKATPLSDRLTRLTVQKILKSWDKKSLKAKAIDAIILSRNGYPTMARKLTASIASFAMSSPEKGMWWDGFDPGEGAGLLKTFELVNPADRKVIDAVAQWLIMSKTVQDWGNSTSTAASVEALIAAIPADQAATAETSVTLNGSALTNDTPQLPGMTVSDISSRLTVDDNSLEISKSTGLPAMGSVISRAVIAMDSIEAHACPSVSVQKRLNLVSGTGVVAADSLQVGDRVRVQLIITATERVDYVTVIDRNAACMEPAQQLSGYRVADGLWFYRETTDTENRMFIEYLFPGTYVIDYEMYITASGRYSSGVATLQSQINPAVDANSSAHRIVVNP